MVPYVLSLIFVALAGFLAGLLAFKAKSRWCPACGRSTADLIEHLRSTGQAHN